MSKRQTTGSSLELDVDGSGGGGGGDVNITEVGGVPVTSPLPVDASGSSVSVSNFPATQPVSGTVTANLGTISTAATAAKQDTGNTSLASIDGKLTSPITVTGPLTDAQLRATPVPISGTVTVDTSLLATAAKQDTGNTSLAQIDTNTDPFLVSGAGGYVRQDSTATIAKETGGNLATVKTNTDPLVTSGGGGYVRQDSTATIAKESGGNLAVIAEPVDSKADLNRIGNPTTTFATSNGTPISTATTTDVVSAPSSGNHLEILFLHASNAGSVSTKVGWKENGGSQIFETQLPQNGVVSKNLASAWHLTTATKLQLVTDAAGSIYWTVGYRTVVD